MVPLPFTFLWRCIINSSGWWQGATNCTRLMAFLSLCWSPMCVCACVSVCVCHLLALLRFDHIVPHNMSSLRSSGDHVVLVYVCVVYVPPRIFCPLLPSTRHRFSFHTGYFPFYPKVAALKCHRIEGDWQKNWIGNFCNNFWKLQINSLISISSSNLKYER